MLHKFVLWEDYEQARSLVESGFDVNSLNAFKENVLFILQGSCSKICDIFSFFIEKGARL